jgi:hypothetical protein
MAIPIAVNVGEPWAYYEGRNIVEYIDLQGAAAGTGAGEAVPYAPKFGRISAWGPRPVIGVWPQNPAAVTVAFAGDGVTTPWTLSLTAVAALAAGVYARSPVRIVFNPGSN